MKNEILLKHFIKQKAYTLLLRHGALFLIIAFAVIQFFLILRHKSPYLSDSYFYKHIYYQIKGDSFESAHQKIKGEIDLTKTDLITRNIFEKDNSYRYSYSFFIKRPLYPLIADFTSFFVSDYVALLIPVLISYLISIILSFYLFRTGLNYSYSILALALFISFYPFLDWSTYFLTDTIGFMFWLAQLIFSYNYLSKGNYKYIFLFEVAFVVSLLNREQSILMLPLFMFTYLLMIAQRYKAQLIKRVRQIVIITAMTILGYVIISKILNLRNIIDTIVYTQNSYGLYNYKYTPIETITYLINTIKVSHVVFIQELSRHHWWFTFFAIGILGFIKTLFFQKKKALISLLILSSGLASYISILIYPVLSYRYFYPIVIMILYFALKYLYEFMEEQTSLLN